MNAIACGDCFAAMSKFEDSSVNLIISDWPYYKVKSLDWDRQWKTVEEYLGWIGQVCAEYRRILAPNGSLYAFASPKPEMAWGIEGEIGKHFNIINRITWRKGEFDTKAEMFPKDALRSYFPASEVIFFAEHYGADNAAKGESGYGAKCDELRGFVFEPLRAYLYGEKERAGLTNAEISASLGLQTHHGGIANHYLGQAQWMLPTARHYATMQTFFNQQGRRPAPPYEDYHTAPRSRFERNHDEREYLRAEYEDLRAEYEYLRRPFNLTAQDQYTDVWDFPTVKAYPGKHPCEKPLEMYEHIIRVSSRSGDLVADFFCGSGVTAEAAVNLGRKFYCSDFLQKHVDATKERVARLEEPALQQLAFSVQTDL